MYENEYTRPSFVAFRPIFRTRCFPRTLPQPVPDISRLSERTDGRTDERADAKKINQHENRDGRVSGGFFFDDAGNYSRLARVDVDGELLDGRTDTSGVYPAHPIFRWSIQFPRQLTPGPGMEGFHADVGSHICTECCWCIGAFAYATHMPARMNFDKTARISTENRTSTRRRVWRRQFNEIQSGLRIADPCVGSRGFFFCIRVVSPRSVGRNRYIPRAGDRLPTGLLAFIIRANWSHSRSDHLYIAKYIIFQVSRIIIFKNNSCVLSLKTKRMPCLSGINKFLL